MFRFEAGAKKKSMKRRYIVGIALGLLVDLLHRYLKVSQETLWALVDEIGREFKIDDINGLILLNSKLLDARIERDVTDAIDDARIEMGHKDPEILPVVFTETLEGETPLGGEMRLRLPTDE